MLGDMAPASARNNQPDRPPAHAIESGEIGRAISRSMGGTDSDDIGISKDRTAIVLSEARRWPTQAKSISMLPVGRVRDPFKIVDRIIAFVPVDMVDFLPDRRWPQKGFCDQAMNPVKCGLVPLAKNNLKVSVAWNQLTTTPRPGAAPTGYSANPAKARSFVVAFEARNGTPLFVVHNPNHSDITD